MTKKIELKDPFLWKTNELPFTIEEEAYRRGFSQGFFVATQRPDLKFKDILSWRYGNEEIGAPGTLYEKIFISCRESQVKNG